MLPEQSAASPAQFEAKSTGVEVRLAPLTPPDFLTSAVCPALLRSTHSQRGPPGHPHDGSILETQRIVRTRAKASISGDLEIHPGPDAGRRPTCRGCRCAMRCGLLFNQTARGAGY